MNPKINQTEPPEKLQFRFGFLQVLGIIAVVIFITAILTAWWVKHNIYASPFTPTILNAQEQKVLEDKLAKLQHAAEKVGPRPETGPEVNEYTPEGKLQPEPYTEEGAKREISLTEKELNGLIANDPDVARRVAIDLSDKLVSVKLVVPMEEDILFLGGKTLRINLGVILSYENDRPVIALKGVTLGGVPLPNAWLGNLKNKNLVEEFGAEGGFWKLFADGVKDLTVKQGHLQVSLKE